MSASSTAVICNRCGTENPDGFRFCGGCGAPLGEPLAPRDARKIVTALFCDVTGWTALSETADPEWLRRVMDEYFAEMRGTIERHGGLVEKFIGDAVMAVFGIPQLHEDDALRAVRAAAEMRERLPKVAAQVGVELRFRTGVNTGPVLVRGQENVAIGDAVNVAARLEQGAQPGEIVIGAETLRMVRDAVEVEPLEPLRLKGKSEPVAAYRLLRVDPAARGIARHLDTPLIGRERESQVQHEVWDRTVETSDCQLFTLLGVAGVGKSRLIAELLERVGGTATVMRGRCLPYGESITFHPVVEALSPIGERAEPVLERLAKGGTATPEELFWTVRRLLETLALERPVILHVDDLQWAEPMLLDLLDHIVDISRGAPILVLCAARPWLLDDRPGWGSGKLNATTLLLEPLSASQCEALVGQMGAVLEPGVCEQIIASSQGNPLFLEEMVALARERSTVEVPSSIQTLLAARLERLGRAERDVLERGAIEGEVFHRVSVEALASAPLESELRSRLADLVRKQLLRPDGAGRLESEAYRFRHLLLRDAAYDALPKGTRAELHARFARFLEQSAESLPDLAELAGWHLERSALYYRELGQAPDAQLLIDAARHLHPAGARARERSDTVAATKLFERALALAPEDRPLQVRIEIDLAEQLIEVGDLTRADELLRSAEAAPHGEEQAALTRFEWLIRMKPEEATQTIESRLPGMLERLGRVGDDRGIAKAHMAAFWVHMLASRPTPAGEQARLAAEHARRAGDRGLRICALGWYIVALVYGRLDVQTIARELDEIEGEDLGPYVAARVDFGRGEVARLEGRFEDARRLTQRAVEGFQALGIPALDACSGEALARTEFSAGSPTAALTSLKRTDAILADLGYRMYRSGTQALLGRAQLQLGKLACARAAVDLAEQLSVPGELVPKIVANEVRSRLALAAGDQDGAERFAREAVDRASGSDYLLFEADARLNLARLLSGFGRTEDATAEARQALELFGAKGDRPGAEETRALLDELAVPG